MDGADPPEQALLSQSVPSSMRDLSLRTLLYNPEPLPSSLKAVHVLHGQMFMGSMKRICIYLVAATVGEISIF